MASNVQAKLENDNLIITLPMNGTGVRSKSGKTIVVASSHGNVPTEVEINGKKVIVGVNAYIKG